MTTTFHCPPIPAQFEGSMTPELVAQPGARVFVFPPTLQSFRGDPKTLLMPVHVVFPNGTRALMTPDNLLLKFNSAGPWMEVKIDPENNDGNFLNLYEVSAEGFTPYQNGTTLSDTSTSVYADPNPLQLKFPVAQISATPNGDVTQSLNQDTFQITGGGIVAYTFVSQSGYLAIIATADPLSPMFRIVAGAPTGSLQYRVEAQGPYHGQTAMRPGGPVSVEQSDVTTGVVNVQTQALAASDPLAEPEITTTEVGESFTSGLDLRTLVSNPGGYAVTYAIQGVPGYVLDPLTDA